MVPGSLRRPYIQGGVKALGDGFLFVVIYFG